MLHDCPLSLMSLDWVSGVLKIQLNRNSGIVDFIHASSLRKFSLSRLEEWGPSECIDEVIGPSPLEEGLQLVVIKMQSGDVIEIVAGAFQLPNK